MLTGRVWKLLFGSPSLDSLLEEIAETDSYERRKVLWQQVIRRFVHDVERACRVARCLEPREIACAIIDEALRGVGVDPAKDFSRQLVRIMKKHLGQNPVDKVIHNVYLRQFLHELPPKLVPYAEGFLDQAGHVEWLADRRNENVDEVRKRCEQVWAVLPRVIEQEYGNEAVVERTDGVWTVAKLREN